LFRQVLLSLFVCSAIGNFALAESPRDDREWPFYPPREIKLPEHDPDDWVRNGVDAFVLQALNQAGLEHAPEATREQLVRRLYFDLIGLPPSPAEVDAFLKDKADRAFERLVDRLLSDRRYGERWARLWLDLARYADTAGYEGDPDLPHAWRYRDYVINSFVKDKPYDLFVKEQIAGDEFDNIMGGSDLPATPSERVVAMTFLRLAPFTEPRGDETRHELLSEMTSTVSSVFLGLTVGCAKCHDHKYDNIPTEDFYRLKAFFSTVSIPRPEPGDGFQIGGPINAGFYRKGEGEWATRRRAELERSVGKAKQELAALKKSLEKRLGSAAGFGLQAMGGSLGNNYIFGRSPVNDDRLHTSIVNGDGKRWSFFTDGRGPETTGSNAGTNKGQWFDDLSDPRHVTLGQYSEGTGRIKTAGAHHVGEFSQILIYDHPLAEVERHAIEEWLQAKYSETASDSPNADASLRLPPQSGLRFWLDASDLDADARTANPKQGSAVNSWKDRVSGITLEQRDPKRQPSLVRVTEPNAVDKSSGATGVRFEDDFLAGPVGDAAFLKDGGGAIVAVYTARHSHEGYGFEVGGNGSFISTFINPKAAGREDLAAVLNAADSKLITRDERRRYQLLSNRGRFVKQQLKRLQPVAMSLRHSYGPPYEPGVPTSRVMIRGQYDSPGKVVQAGFPSVVTGHQKPATIRLDPFKRWPTRSRRMALAEWIASPNNPLTSRVMVNRLWHWHFGRGIVATPSDFGALSEGASHPELLDWLAVQFVKKKWNIKAMHRLIVTSATYRQSSVHSNAKAAEVDPDNTLLWQFRRRRLEAEAVRDSVLSASGRLNTEQFGLPIFPPLPGGIEERVKYTTSKWNTQTGPEGRKRSIYIYQQRTLTMPFLQAFDSLVCDESRPRRRHSVTPLQALAMYNGEFVSTEARHFADRLKREAGANVNDQIDLAFRIAMGRPPDVSEAAAMQKLISRSGTETPATEPHGTVPQVTSDVGLVGVCRVLLNTNEFVYVD
jgi:hypothetical protein